MTMEEVGIKNYKKLRDVIYKQPPNVVILGQTKSDNID
jgi:hypothetical protein